LTATQIYHGGAEATAGKQAGSRPGEFERPVRSSAMEKRLAERRRQIMALRRLVVLGDIACTLIAVGLLLVAGRPVAGVTAAVVALAVTAHAYGADRPRGVVALRPILKAAVVLGGLACVAVAVVDVGPLGRDVWLGAACISAAFAAFRLPFRLPAVAKRFGFGRRRRLIVGDPQALETASAMRSPLVESGEVVLVVTRAESDKPEVPPRLTEDAGPLPNDQRRHRDTADRPTGLVERIVRTALDNSAERVTVLPGNTWGRPQLRELSWLLEDTGIDMVIATSLDGIAPHRVDIVEQDGRLNIKVASARARGATALARAVLDRVAALVLLLLTSPVLLAIAAAVRIDSKGPAIFRQTRVREGGATFTMYKFRTMQVDAEDQLSELQEMSVHGSDEPLFKVVDDPRITRMGHLLRMTSLDELPQLINVVKGEMSLIGPRPALPVEVELYDFVARRRLAVKPGMTGLWQVSGRSRLTWDESIGFDLEYVDNWSPITDAAIAVKTVKAVVTKDGAY
jgi:exopolysaccharide biosynthesis polyprenyl glycosylphosphotransferase